MDVQTLITKAGGVVQLAAKAGVARTTVLDWRKSGFIPGNRVAIICRELRVPVKDVLMLVAPAELRDPAPTATENAD